MAVGELVSGVVIHPTSSSNHPLLGGNAGSRILSSIVTLDMKVVHLTTHFGYVGRHEAQGVCTLPGGDDDDMRSMVLNLGARIIPKVDVRNTNWDRGN